MKFILPDKKEPNKVKEAENRIEESKAVENKTEPISQEGLNAIFTEASERLSLIYKGGEFEYCRTHHPELYQAERGALNYVDRLWFDALAGKASLEVFRVAVNRWHEIVIALVNTHIENEKTS